MGHVRRMDFSAFMPSSGCSVDPTRGGRISDAARSPCRRDSAQQCLSIETHVNRGDPASVQS
jgi:hypothetical protein